MSGQGVVPIGVHGRIKKSETIMKCGVGCHYERALV